MVGRAPIVRAGSLALVTGSGSAGQGPRLTRRGAATRRRIIEAAAELMYVKGVSSTTLDEVRAASGTSKSQLYTHFADKEQLVRAVVRLRAEEIMEREHAALQRLRSFNGLVRWRDAIVQRNALQKGAYGCILGSIAGEVSDRDEVARLALDKTFEEWENLIEAGLRRMQDARTLTADADPRKLAVGLMAALQGGYLLAQTAHDVTPMEIALDMALDHVRMHLSP
ncbi:TetR/AcrR family transcriptional regulator [Actinomadura madurae]|uniref:TetR/AcrR family transcriptional regulator n=1 Tax=Actinomadura madurae TaxID=1993 RepID=UPI0027E3A0A8|nr:TetR family transcriptional regulator [Actinomadura madurae]